MTMSLDNPRAEHIRDKLKSNKAGVTCKALGKELGVSNRVIGHYLSKLRDLGLAVLVVGLKYDCVWCAPEYVAAIEAKNDILRAEYAAFRKARDHRAKKQTSEFLIAKREALARNRQIVYELIAAAGPDGARMMDLMNKTGMKETTIKNYMLTLRDQGKIEKSVPTGSGTRWGLPGIAARYAEQWEANTYERERSRMRRQRVRSAEKKPELGDEFSQVIVSANDAPTLRPAGPASVWVSWMAPTQADPCEDRIPAA